MTPVDDIENIEHRLALVYAPVEVRGALATLWRLDQRLGGVVRRGGEPMVAAIRLAWWREALERLDQGAPPAEPLLQAIGRELLPLGVSGSEISALEQGWAVLLDSEPDEEALGSHASARGATLFGLSARLLGCTLPEGGRAAGEVWALADLALEESGSPLRDRAVGAAALRLHLLPKRWPPRLRALGMLTALARRDILRGNAPAEPRGSPARVGRALWHRLSGR